MNLPAQTSPRIAALHKKLKSARGRLIFGIDATASRGETWDLATQLQAEMSEEAAKIGGLDLQLIFYRGPDEVRKSEWLSDPYELIRRMGTIRCMAGATKIARVLKQS